MIVKFLGFLDLLAAGVMILYFFEIIPYKFVLSLGLYLIFKAIMFFGDFLSFLDGVVGLYMLLMFFWTPGIITTIFSVYLIIKSLLSLGLADSN